jgi:hypothetical protein
VNVHDARFSLERLASCHYHAAHGCDTESRFDTWIVTLGWHIRFDKNDGGLDIGLLMLPDVSPIPLPYLNAVHRF